MGGKMGESCRGLTTAMTALYLRGLDRCLHAPPRDWLLVADVLRRGQSSSLADFDADESSERLEAAGFHLESLVLRDRRLVDHAVALVEGGRVLVAFDEGFPFRWTEKFGSAAPPVLWWNGVLPETSRGTVSIVGSRKADTAARAFVEAVASEAAHRGRTVVSGGAQGCDRIAAHAAWRTAERRSSSFDSTGSPIIEILPYGLAHARPAPWTQLSLEPWDAPFSAAAAMERNRLIYAASNAAVVGRVWRCSGGSWQGAVAALRKRLACLFVFDGPVKGDLSTIDDFSIATCRLAALGARLTRCAEDVWRAIDSDESGSFDAGSPGYSLGESRGLWGIVGEVRPAAYAA